MSFFGIRDIIFILDIFIFLLTSSVAVVVPRAGLRVQQAEQQDVSDRPKHVHGTGIGIRKKVIS